MTRGRTWSFFPLSSCDGSELSVGLRTADVYLLINGNLGNRRARRGETNKQTNIQTNEKKKTHNSTGDAADAHSRSSPAENTGSLSHRHPIIPCRRPGAAFITLPLSNRFACRCCCCNFFFFFSESNLGGNVEELPPSTSSP